ncbi:dinitrogenase iron-molybdenum cofactor biosynthesis protein [Nitrincola sp. A-D6]|uniref:dinitrogenase iron-molybdenum cofactor biosynthesis protein n=1 Tax=Nitrincola sp. A-D6 TaxID=1545442 RepID=UPI0006909A63|nr:dinitrogenase iron-molybdenum cofactor biosynthesis protein [Nitrincola sp. A-D6]
MSSISQGAARRLSHAARLLSEQDPAIFIVAIGSYLGLPITEDKLQTLTVEDINRILSGDDGELPEDYNRESIKNALQYLWGEQEAQVMAPEVETMPAAMQDSPSIKVAVASNNAEQLDGHFGSCLRFLIYRVNTEGLYLADVRDASSTHAADDRNTARAELISDCQLLYVQSIGGPAAAKVVRAGVHPIKFPKPGAARETLQTLQNSLISPPPGWPKFWARKVPCYNVSLPRLKNDQSRHTQAAGSGNRAITSGTKG